MLICGQHFTGSIIARIQEKVNTDPLISRRQLSRQVCEWLDWRKPDGELKDMSCRKALCELSRRNLLNLPEANGAYDFNKRQSLTEIEVPAVEETLDQLGRIVIEPVSSRRTQASRQWSALMEQYHYLGGGPLCGCQIRYLIISEKYGNIGGLAFTSASFALQARDDYIGWSEAARRSNLHLAVNNARFLIVPSVRVKNLASHALSLALDRLAQDWQERYYVRPVFVETFVDPTRFAGVCYKAANWKHIGETSGRRDGICKHIFVYELDRGWRDSLCAEAPIRLGAAPRPESPDNWMEEEFGAVRFYDQRLKQRLYAVARDFYANPQSGIPEACKSRARTVGAYRFFQNEKVTMDVLLTGHCEASIERIKEHDVVLAPQDTTTLNYSTHPATTDLGPICSTDSVIGLMVHDTLAFTETGVPLGVLDAQCWARDIDDAGEKKRPADLPIEEKESVKWLRSYRKVSEIQKLCPDTMLVSMGDRESDIYELFMEADQNPDGPKLLVRAAKSRRRKVVGKSIKKVDNESVSVADETSDPELLWDFMAKQSVAGSLKIHVPGNGSRKSRNANLDIRFAQIKLLPPHRHSDYSSINAWAVYAVEKEQGKAVSSPIEWMLLTTVETRCFEDAQKRIEWYAGRWGIEVFHRTLKSGCRIEDRQLGTADRLEACLAVDMVVAWRIYHLTMLGRQTPDLPCTEFFSDIEWKALCCYVNKTPVVPEKPPTLCEAIRMVAQMGGHQGRRRDGPPGTQTLWRGLQRLQIIAELYEIITKKQHPHPHKAGP